MLDYRIRQLKPTIVVLHVSGEIMISGVEGYEHATRIANEMMRIERTGESEPSELPRPPLPLQERLREKITFDQKFSERKGGPLEVAKKTEDLKVPLRETPTAPLQTGEEVTLSAPVAEITGQEQEKDPTVEKFAKAAAEASREQQPESALETPAGYSTYSKEEDAIIEACESGKEAVEKYIEKFGEGKRTANGIKYHFRQLKGLLKPKGSTDRKSSTDRKDQINYNPWSPDELEILKKAETAAEAWDLFHEKYPESPRSKGSVKGQWYAQNPKGLNKSKLSDEKRREIIKESQTVAEARERIKKACGGTPHPGKLLREFQQLHQEDPGDDTAEPTPAPAPEQPPQEPQPARFKEKQHVKITCHEKERYVGATGNIQRVNNGSETCIVRVFGNDELIRFECLEAVR